MANNANLIRDEVKICRDGIKANYVKDTECYICASQDNLQLHHFASFSILWENWKVANNVHISSFDDVKNIRDSFYKDHWHELVEDCVTLCKVCHNDRLHKIYGKAPSLYTAKKQSRWVTIQRNKRLDKHGVD